MAVAFHLRVAYAPKARGRAGNPYNEGSSWGDKIAIAEHDPFYSLQSSRRCYAPCNERIRLVPPSNCTPQQHALPSRPSALINLLTPLRRAR